MSQPTLTLHIGPHKTGSTALQHRLLNSSAYLNEHGVDYPSIGLLQFAHHRINALLKNDAAGAGGLTEDGLRALADPGRNVILSSEDFIYLPTDKLTQLKQLLSGFRIEVILFVRSPVNLWPSHWQELVKHGREETLLEYVGAYFGLNGTIDARFMNPTHQAMRFANVFGKENLRIFCYDNMVAGGSDIFDFFTETILRLPPRLPREVTPKVNRSLRPDMVEMLRCLNVRYRERMGQPAKSAIMSAYHRAQAGIEAEPGYADFGAAFKKHAQSLHFDSVNDVFRRRDNHLMSLFGEQIENKAEPSKLFAAECKKTVIYGARYWADHFGFARFIDATMDLLNLEAPPPPAKA